MDGLAIAAACLLLGIVVSIIIVADVLNDRGARRFDRLVATRLAQRRSRPHAIWGALAWVCNQQHHPVAAFGCITALGGSIGNLRQAPIATIVARNLRAFRESFDVGANPVCVRCVCSLKTSWRSAPWS